MTTWLVANDRGTLSYRLDFSTFATSTEGMIHSCLFGLSGSMVLAGCSFSNSYHWATRTVKNQPDSSFHSPRDQAIDQHCKHGREFKHHVAGRWRADQICKGEQEQGCKPIDQGNYRAVGIGPNQLQSDAKRNDGLEDSEQQPNQLSGLKSEDALLSFWFAL